MNEVSSEDNSLQEQEKQEHQPEVLSPSLSSLTSCLKTPSPSSSSDTNNHFSPSSSSSSSSSSVLSPASTSKLTELGTSSTLISTQTSTSSESNINSKFATQVVFVSIENKTSNVKGILAEEVNCKDPFYTTCSTSSSVPVVEVARGESSSCSSSLSSLESPNRQQEQQGNQGNSFSSEGSSVKTTPVYLHQTHRLRQTSRLNQNTGFFLPPASGGLLYPSLQPSLSPSVQNHLFNCPALPLDSYCQLHPSAAGFAFPSPLFPYEQSSAMNTNPTLFYGNSSSTASSSSSTPSLTTTTTTMTPPSMIPHLNPPRFGTTIPNRIFVGGITTDTSECDLEALFGRFGNVNAVKIINDRAGVPRGYGFVTFDSEEEAKRVLREGDNLVLKGRKLNVAIAVKKQPIGRVDLVPFYASAAGGLDPTHIPFHQSHPQLTSSGLMFPHPPPPSASNGISISHHALQGCPSIHPPSSPMAPFSPMSALFGDPYSPFVIPGMESQAATAAVMAALYGSPNPAAFSPTIPVPSHHHHQHHASHQTAESQQPPSSSLTNASNGPGSGHHHQQTHHQASPASHSSSYLFYPGGPSGGGHQTPLAGHFTFLPSTSPANPSSHHHHPSQHPSLHTIASHHPHASLSSASGSMSGGTSSSSVGGSHPTAATSPSSSSTTTWVPPPATSYMMPPVLVNNHLSHVS